MSGTKNIFFIYTKEDSALLLQVLDQLYPLKKEAGVSFWYDDPIYPDKNWYPQIVSRFEEADVYIFLISNSFMHSSFIQQLEFKQVVDRYKHNDALLIPIVIDDCPWDIDFNSDEYTFSFKQLHVLPEAERPITSWDSPKEALELSTEYIKRTIVPNINYAEDLFSEVGTDQIVEDEPKEDKVSERENDQVEPQAEPVPDSKTEEVQNDIGSEETINEPLEPKEEVLPQSETMDQVETVQVINEREEEAYTSTSSAEAQDTAYQNDETSSENTNSRKRIGIGIAAAVLIILGSIVLSQFGEDATVELPADTNEVSSTNNTLKPENERPVSTANEVPIAEQSEATSQNGAAARLTLAVGDDYGDGLIFEIDNDGKTGIIVHQKDLGPMIWNDAITIHEELGYGWRLPTHEELKSMYSTLGQGAENKGEFADELYWSATPYDENQAKLVRFSDGNASYHYNSRGTHRQFLVRAVRDFNLD